MTATAVKTAVCLERDCRFDGCAEFADRLHTQLNTRSYTHGVSLMAVPDDFEGWRREHRTARKRADWAARAGYRFSLVDYSDFNTDIHEINTSLPERQGRPMSDGYLTPASHSPLPEQPCPRHRITTYGVHRNDRLWAYLTMYRAGELCLISSILGHGTHLRNNIMYLLVAGMVDDQAGTGGFFYYNRHDSGLDGLRFFKERLGFTAQDIEWELH